MAKSYVKTSKLLLLRIKQLEHDLLLQQMLCANIQKQRKQIELELADARVALNHWKINYEKCAKFIKIKILGSSVNFKKIVDDEIKLTEQQSTTIITQTRAQA